MRSPAERPGRRRQAIALVASIVFAAALPACSDDDDGADRTVVEVFGPIVGAPGRALGDALRAVSAGSEVELRYVGVTSFDEQLDDRLARGDRPGVVLLPQPGRLQDLTDRGLAQPLPGDVAAASADQFPSRLVDLVTIAGEPAAVWVTVDVKSLVWYRPSEFAARGLEVPGTLAELTELSEAIRTGDDGVAPWCLTMEAGGSTGWVGTDWVEDLALRRLGPDQYDRWAQGELAFDSDEITGVFDELDALLRAPGATAGGSRAVLTTPWERSAEMLLAGTPTCLMAHQADFLRREFPDGTTIGPEGDIDFFVLPSADGSPPPMVLGGTLAVPLSTGDAVASAMRLIAGPELAERLDRTAAFLSPHLDADASTDVDATTRRVLQLLSDADEVRFDGSDLMPPVVGTGTFWAGMRAFFAGEDVESVVTEIQGGWPLTG